jgi:hypothetical protein
VRTVKTVKTGERVLREWRLDREREREKRERDRQETERKRERERERAGKFSPGTSPGT